MSRMVDVDGVPVSYDLLLRLQRMNPTSTLAEQAQKKANEVLADYEVINFVREDLRIEQGFEHTTIGKQIMEHIKAIQQIVQRTVQNESLDSTATISYSDTIPVYYDGTEMEFDLNIKLKKDLSLFEQYQIAKERKGETVEKV